MGNEVYDKLARHLAVLGMGYPEKDELLDILRENFIPQEAEAAVEYARSPVPPPP